MRSNQALAATEKAGSHLAKTCCGVFMHDENLLSRCADRKSTRLNSSHSQISYAVFCLKKKKKQKTTEAYLTETKVRSSGCREAESAGPHRHDEYNRAHDALDSRRMRFHDEYVRGQRAS